MSLTLICVYVSAWACIPAHDFVCLCRLGWDSKKTTREDDRACYCIYTPKLPPDKMQTGCCAEGESGNKRPHQRWLQLIPPHLRKINNSGIYLCHLMWTRKWEHIRGIRFCPYSENEAQKDMAHSAIRNTSLCIILHLRWRELDSN